MDDAAARLLSNAGAAAHALAGAVASQEPFSASHLLATASLALHLGALTSSLATIERRAERFGQLVLGAAAPSAKTVKMGYLALRAGLAPMDGRGTWERSQLSSSKELAPLIREFMSYTYTPAFLALLGIL